MQPLFRKNLNLPHPKKLDIALPANMRSGRPENNHYPSAAEWGPVEQNYEGMPQIADTWVSAHLDQITVLDVRDPDEVAGETIPIKNAVRIPLDELTGRLKEIPADKPIVTVCRSGKRSAQAAVLLKKNGIQNVANLKGGMLAWHGHCPVPAAP